VSGRGTAHILAFYSSEIAFARSVSQIRSFHDCL
jgi:hypothetical protein